jgi:hypothetical protein
MVAASCEKVPVTPESEIMALGSRYTRGLRALSGYWGTWEPTVPIKVGTIGTLDGRVLIPTGHLSALPGLATGIPATTLERRKVRAAWRRGVSWSSGGEVNASVPGANATIELHFMKGLSFLLTVAGADYRAFNDLRTVARVVLSQYKENNWNPDDILITHVVEAPHVTVIVSGESGGGVTIAADVVPEFFRLEWLADAAAAIKVSHEKGVGFSCYAARATPLYRAIQLDRNWLGRETMSLVRGETTDPMAAFREPDIGES